MSGMLVLSRNQGERVVLCDGQMNIIATIMVISERNGQVKSGFNAAPDIVILREELYLNNQRTGRLP